MPINLKLGADPELFLVDPKTGQYVSAHDKLPGTKENPFPVPLGAVQVDGVAAEFNIDPAESADAFLKNIRSVKLDLEKRLSGYSLKMEPCAVFDPGYWKGLPEKTRELGCNPDFNAWSGEINPAPDGESTTMRTASGHIHIGWCTGVDPRDPYHFQDCCNVVKQLDYFIGLPSLLWDPDPRRRSLYGKAGAFRPKSYGAEYRALSNVWMRSEPVTLWLFGAVQAALNAMLSGGGQSCFEKFGNIAQQWIDNNVTNWNETPTGKQVLRHMNIRLPDYSACLQKIDVPVKKAVGETPKTVKRRAKYTFDDVIKYSNADSLLTGLGANTIVWQGPTDPF